jgi:hypothetical protein
MNKFLLLPIVFNSNDHTEAPNHVRLEFTDKDIERINKLIDLAKEHSITIEMNFDCEELFRDTYDDDEDKMEVADWRCDVQYLKIYSSGHCYFYAQNKWDAADQIESECFTIANILESELQPN